MVRQWLERRMVRKVERDERDFLESMSPRERAAFEAWVNEPIDPEALKRVHQSAHKEIERIRAKEEERRRRRESRWFRRFFRWIRGYLTARW